MGRKEAFALNEKAKPSVKSLLGKLATVLNFRKASSEEQPAVPENPTKSDAITFDPYPYEEGQLAQLDSNSRFPLLPELNPAEHKELPSSIIEKLNKDIKTDLVSYVLDPNSFVLRKDALLDLLRNEHTRVIEASRTLEPTDKPRIYHEIVNIKGNLVSVHRRTKSDEDQPIINPKSLDESLSGVLSVNPL